MKYKKWLYLYQNPDGQYIDVIENVIPHTNGNIRKMQRAHFVIDLDTGFVIKDRWNGDANRTYEGEHLEVLRREYGYYGIKKKDKHFDDSLFNI